jgi:hypothetical protein
MSTKKSTAAAAFATAKFGVRPSTTSSLPYSPAEAAKTVVGGLALFTTVVYQTESEKQSADAILDTSLTSQAYISQSKHGSVDDSQHAPCISQSDTRE